MNTSQVESLRVIPWLNQIDDPEVVSLLDSAHTVILPAGVSVFRSGDQCHNFLLVIEGSVRVQKLAENGREIVLYRVEEGQSCILTTACLLGGGAYQAEAITETPVKALVMPGETFHTMIERSRPFREFVFNAYMQRLTDLLMLIEAITFGRIEARLAAHLLKTSNPDGMLQATHQTLARDLGSAREVVSRMLKEFERRGMVELGRGRITLLNRELLAETALM